MRAAALLVLALFPTMAFAQASSTEEINRALGANIIGRSDLPNPNGRNSKPAASAPLTKAQIRERVMNRLRLNLRYFISEKFEYDYRDECFVIAARADQADKVDFCIRDEEEAILALNRDWMKLTPGERRDCANITRNSIASSPAMSLTLVAACMKGSLN